jgi:hypothetical protein
MSARYYWVLGVVLTSLGCSNDEQSLDVSGKMMQAGKDAVTQPLIKEAGAADGVTYKPVPMAGFRSNLPDWRPSEEYIVSAAKGHPPAHIMWGPSIRLPAGAVKGYVKLRLGELAGIGAGERLCGFDVFDGKRSLTEGSLMAGAPEDGVARSLPFAFDLTPEQAESNIEFRLYCWGKTDVTVESVYLSTPT